MHATLLLTASELVTAYRRRELSPVEAAKASLERIEETAASINAFVLVDAYGALNAAQESEQRWRAGEPLGPIDGVPLALKDSNWARDWPTRIGSRTTPDEPSATDAPYVKSLRDAGAVFVGKTATSEYCWTGATFSHVHGVTRNPWNTTLCVGGSSGGAGAAVAAAMIPLALGTDAGGSIRTPAALCGTVGFKPSFGRIALDDRDGCSTFNSVGPITHTVEDAETVFRILIGEIGGTGTTGPERLDAVRIAVSPTMGYARSVEPVIAAAVIGAADVLGRLGASVIFEDPPLEWPVNTYNTLAWAEQAHTLMPIVEKHAAEMEPGLVRIVEIGSRIGLAEYIAANRKRWQIIRTMERFHETIDVLLTPALPVTAFDATRISPDSDDVTQMNDWLPFSSVFNLTGQPALTVPLGFDAESLPFGIQFVGRTGADLDLLKVARVFDRVTGQFATYRAAAHLAFLRQGSPP